MLFAPSVASLTLLLSLVNALPHPNELSQGELARPMERALPTLVKRAAFPSGTPSAASTQGDGVGGGRQECSAIAPPPSGLPSGIASDLPSGGPTGLPSGVATGLPSGLPSGVPSGLPSALPTGAPSASVVVSSSLPVLLAAPSSAPGNLPSGSAVSMRALPSGPAGGGQGDGQGGDQGGLGGDQEPSRGIDASQTLGGGPAASFSSGSFPTGAGNGTGAGHGGKGGGGHGNSGGGAGSGSGGGDEGPFELLEDIFEMLGCDSDGEEGGQGGQGGQGGDGQGMGDGNGTNWASAIESLVDSWKQGNGGGKGGSTTMPSHTISLPVPAVSSSASNA